MAATPAPAAGPIKLENTSKRDFLQGLERKYQQAWAAAGVFHVDAPTGDAALQDMSPEEIRAKYPKFFATIPYPYMNGSLHLGHAFTLSKVEFATGYERMCGKRALFPWAFHCTGMPIRAAADKLIREIELFGEDFAGANAAAEAAAAEEGAAPAGGAEAPRADKATKGKLAGKATGLKYQFQIMENSNVPRAEIKKFADPTYWLQYFPPIAQRDCDAFGLRIDWRRAFVTTDVNPYYDSFVRWQMNRLKHMDKIKFGERYTIYSPKDGQPCMDHDRAEGEGLGPQQYTGLKMDVVQWAPAARAFAAPLANRRVFFVAATLRPETMYGQTNCFVGPALEYGAYAVNDTDVYVCTARAARNFAFQGLVHERGRVDCLGTTRGAALVGTLVRAPLAVHEEVYVLPMDSVLATKGTGVVTSVPSDSPDDWATYMDLRKKAAFYQVDPAWLALDPVPVIRTPEFGDMIAERVVQQFKVQGPKDKNALAQAKDVAYKQGFYAGTMIAGRYAGEPVADAKPKVQRDLVDGGRAFVYAEPEGKIISRSADECVVALCDQWYLDYGEAAWQDAARRLLAQMNTFQPETRHSFEHVLGWLHQWACARSYGLGSRLPWDPQYLVESLSDSTIYMAYYTVAHHLQGGVIDGSTPGPLGIRAEQLTDALWDYVLGDAPFPADSDVPQARADVLRREFRYFYPMDLRSSGKDLITNHLTFCIYNHAALFPEAHWPRAMRANGHLMLNGAKMSKSTGNSLSLREAVDKFGADAARISLADAGDGIEDANFEEKTANANILRLHTLIDWCADMTQQVRDGRLRRGPRDAFWDRTFENEMNAAIATANDAYARAAYKEATKAGFYEFQSSRDLYREATADIGMHADLVQWWIATQALLIAPIAPHFAEHVWMGILGNPTSVHNTRFPTPSAEDAALSAAAAYVRGTIKAIRDAEIAVTRKKVKGAQPKDKYDERKPKEVSIYVADAFPDWQNICVTAVQNHFDHARGAVDDAAVRADIAAKGLLKDKRAMPFIMAFKKRIAEFGPELAFNRQLPFNEMDTLNASSGYLKKTLGFRDVHLVKAGEALARADELQGKHGFDRSVVEGAEPGSRRFAALMGFLLMGSSFVLQLVQNSISLPYIHGLYFEKLVLPSQTYTQRLFFGIWSACIENPSGFSCSKVSLAPQDIKTNGVANIPLNTPGAKNLSYALVLQPIAAGFAGLAAAGALLALCTNSLAWTMAALWATILTIAALVVELVLFINRRDVIRSGIDKIGANQPYSVELGPAVWIQVAATAAAVLAVLALFAAWALSRPSTPAYSPTAAPVPPSLYDQHTPTAQPVAYAKGEDAYGYSPPLQQVVSAPPPRTSARYDTYEPGPPYPSAPPPVVMTSGAGRAYDSDQPYDKALAPMPTRQSQMYDPGQAGSMTPVRRAKSTEVPDTDRGRRHSRRHSHRSDRPPPRESTGPRNQRHSYEYDYDYDLPGKRYSYEYGDVGHLRRRSHDPYRDLDADADTPGLARRASRLYPEDSGLPADYGYSVADTQQRWRRYSDRGMY
ncbi:leucine--tRNA ligase [Malassezia sp. CBS 17886]|nr:leucine--tRNA ligase [Malassezia sp. CBS 17886]